MALNKRIVDEVVREDIEQPKGKRVLTQLERLSIVEIEVENVKGSIDDGFKRIEGWIKTVVTFGVGKVILGLGTLSYNVMIYNVSVNSEMKTYIEKAITASEEKTKATITASGQKTGRVG
ncbi:hypothetical protein BDZ91DRAFT_778626 [Kalaharituber pfeilii]|nr:hypothetical protein BDZ91DRAFT_778626 [Kalaharituber pfeilii]